MYRSTTPGCWPGPFSCQLIVIISGSSGHRPQQSPNLPQLFCSASAPPGWPSGGVSNGTAGSGVARTATSVRRGYNRFYLCSFSAPCAIFVVNYAARPTAAGIPYYPGSKEGHIPTRSASEGSGAFPSLARRVNMQQHAELPCRGNSDTVGPPPRGEIRCQLGGNPGEIRCQFTILARKDEPTPDYALDACRSRNRTRIVSGSRDNSTQPNRSS